MFGRVHQIEPDIPLRKIVHRSVVGFLDAQCRVAVGNCHATKHDFDVPTLRQQVDTMIGAGDKTGGGVRHIDFLQKAVTSRARYTPQTRRCSLRAVVDR